MHEIQSFFDSVQIAHLAVGVVAFMASVLTFFSGFGLGTILTPVFVFFFPAEIAISLTAIVHLLNNLFKYALMSKHLNREVLLKFGVASFIGAVAGSWLLSVISAKNLHTSFGEFNLLNCLIGFLILGFALFELIPQLQQVEFKNRLISGGLISGFFGGFSGHQGALRSMFLSKAGIDKYAFVATGVCIALVVDFARISNYFLSGVIKLELIQSQYTLLLSAILPAILGAILGKQLLKKVTIAWIQWSIGILMALIGLWLIFTSF